MFAVLVLVSTLLVACAGSDDDPTPTPPSTATSAPTATSEPVPSPPTATATIAVSPTPTTVSPTVAATATATVPVSPTATRTTPTATAEREAEEVTLEVVQQGFSEVQSFNEVAYGFIVENPEDDMAVINSQYRVTAYSGTEQLEVDTGYLDYVLPGQRVGVGGSIIIPAGRDADSIVVELTPGETAEAELDPGFSIDTVRYYPTDTFPSATGVIRTTSDVPIQDFEVFAVAFDEAGAIVGGGYTFVSFILPGKSSGVEVNVSSADEPASVQLFPVLTSLSIFALNDPGHPEAQQLAVVSEGFGPSTFPNELGWGLIVENPNVELAAETTAYQITAYAEDGSVLGVFASFIALVLPGDRVGSAGSFYVPSGTTASRLEFDVIGRYFTETTVEPGYLSSLETVFAPDPVTPKVTGTIQNNLERPLNDIEVYAVAYDGTGRIIGGGFTFVDLIEADSEHPVEVTIAVGQEPASVELFATVGSLAEIE